MRSKADESFVIVETLICPLQISLAKHSELGSKYLPETYSKSTKIAITACKFFSREHAPWTPLKLFLFLNQLQIFSAVKNTLEKNVEIMPPPLLKFLVTPMQVGVNFVKAISFSMLL